MSHTATAAPMPAPTLPAAVLARGRAWWAAWRARRHQAELDRAVASLRGLSAHTLRDIGAPEWMQPPSRGRWRADLDRLHP